MVLKNMIQTLALLAGMANFWQGMYQIYRFENCDTRSAVISFSISFLTIFVTIFSITCQIKTIK